VISSVCTKSTATHRVQKITMCHVLWSLLPLYVYIGDKIQTTWNNNKSYIRIYSKPHFTFTRGSP